MINLAKLFDYDDWANREALTNLRAISNPPIRAVQLFSHIVAAQTLWLERIEARKQSMAVWPELPLDECPKLLDALGESWKRLLSGCDEAALKRVVQYTNTQGEPWSNRVEDILMHVIAHGAYHRGQIATHLRLAGHVPAYTDFIHAVRQGFVS